MSGYLSDHDSSNPSNPTQYKINLQIQVLETRPDVFHRKVQATHSVATVQSNVIIF